jgi:preprotein translocase subunit SecG
MNQLITIIQITVSIILIGAILLQAKGTGLGSAWGGGGEMYRSKRGVEKILYTATILLCVVFLISSILGLIIK